MNENILFWVNRKHRYSQFLEPFGIFKELKANRSLTKGWNTKDTKKSYKKGPKTLLEQCKTVKHRSRSCFCTWEKGWSQLYTGGKRWGHLGGGSEERDGGIEWRDKYYAFAFLQHCRTINKLNYLFWLISQVWLIADSATSWTCPLFFSGTIYHKHNVSQLTGLKSLELSPAEDRSLAHSHVKSMFLTVPWSLQALWLWSCFYFSTKSTIGFQKLETI